MTVAVRQHWPHHSDVVHDRNFELPVHEGFVRVGDFVVQHKLQERKMSEFIFAAESSCGNPEAVCVTLP